MGRSKPDSHRPGSRPRTSGRLAGRFCGGAGTEITREDKEMTLVDTILTGLVMLLGTEGEHYLILERDLDEWKIVGYLRRN